MNRRDIFKMFGGAAAIPAVKSIESLEMKPDDTLIVTCYGHASDENLHYLKGLVESRLPGQRVMVVDESISFSVLRSNK